MSSNMKQFGLLIFLVAIPLLNANPQFWYINDINYDPTYNTTAESCVGDVTDRNPVGHYQCDAPWEMVEGAIRKMEIMHGTPEFIIWGGANGFHTNSSNTVYSEELMLEIMTKITDLFEERFPNIQVVPVLGNHDWWPKSQLPANGDGSDGDLYDKYYELWKEKAWIPASEESNFKKAGYYAISLYDDRINAIVLNSDLYLPENKAVSGSDPGGQFAWLTNQLNSARQEKEKVHIISHAPLGTLEPEYDARLLEIIREYSDVITAIYGGNEKTDQFRLIYDTDGTAVAFILLAPSLSPRQGADSSARNPAFRRFYIDLDGSLIDSEQFHMDLAEHKDWESLYRYSRFGMIEITTKNLETLLSKMEAYGSQEFHDYHWYKYVGIGFPYYEPCSCRCKYSEICAIRNVESDLYQKCLEGLSATCGADKKYYSVVLMFVLFTISKIIHL